MERKSIVVQSEEGRQFEKSEKKESRKYLQWLWKLLMTINKKSYKELYPNSLEVGTNRTEYYPLQLH